MELMTIKHCDKVGKNYHRFSNENGNLHASFESLLLTSLHFRVLCSPYDFPGQQPNVEMAHKTGT